MLSCFAQGPRAARKRGAGTGAPTAHRGPLMEKETEQRAETEAADRGPCVLMGTCSQLQGVTPGPELSPASAAPSGDCPGLARTQFALPDGAPRTGLVTGEGAGARRCFQGPGRCCHGTCRSDHTSLLSPPKAQGLQLLQSHNRTSYGTPGGGGYRGREGPMGGAQVSKQVTWYGGKSPGQEPGARNAGPLQPSREHPERPTGKRLPVRTVGAAWASRGQA